MTIKIEYLEEEIPVYDITVEGTHNFFANQILIHNCVEITLKTNPLQSLDDEHGRIATCILSAINLGKIKNDDDMKHVCNLAVRGLEELIDYQEYPMKAAEISTKAQRNLGIGYTNFAYYLAKHKLSWDSEEARQLVHETTESMQYYLLEASNQLAIEKGKCEEFEQTKYAKGIFPIDTYKRDIDEFANFELKKDWDGLRKKVYENGLRHSTLTAFMPCESSSAVTSSTSGIDPVRSYLTTKKSKSGVLKLFVPEFPRLKNYYELLWDMKSMEPYLKMLAIIQKFNDQSISTNTSYNPLHYPDNKLPMNIIVKDVLTAYKYGLKTLYYNNTYKPNDDEDDESGCISGACRL